MKITIAAILFVVFSSLNYLADYLVDEKISIELDQNKQAVNDDLINTSESETVSTYKIDVNFDESKKTIDIAGTLNWINRNNTSINEVLMNIPANTEASSKLKYIIDYDEMFAQFKYEFIPIESDLFIDSSLIKLHLNDELKIGDTLKFDFVFSIAVSSKQKWGKSLFLQFENWYPQIAVFSSNEFQAYPQHKYIKTFSEFSNFQVKLTIPSQYQVAAPRIIETIENNERRFIRCSINNITSFNWMIFNNYIEFSSEVSTISNNIDLKIFVQKGNENYINRYSETVEKYLNTLSKYFALPFTSLTIIEQPQNENLIEKSYPNILATNSKIISPIGSQNLEYKIASLLAEQYFGNIVASDNSSQAWISKGVSAYIAEKLVRNEYGELYSYFSLARYYPVRGLHFFSYSDIPLVYSIGDEIIPEGGRFIDEYYKNFIYSNCSFPSYKFPNYETFRVASVVKPQLALLTFERYLGSENLFANLSDYYNQYKYQHPTSNQFLEVLQKGCSKGSESFIHDLFKTGKRFDYAIKYIKEVSENNYELLAERREEGIAPIVIIIHTEKDTIKLAWDGTDDFKSFKFYSQNRVVSAELDPQRENLLDMNYSNNSYVIETKYWGSLSFATRLFFWFQNALMIMGSIG